MKILPMTLSIVLLMLAAVTDAQAVVCANGVYRAGCAGPNGAVVRRKPVVVAPRRVVVAPAYRRGCRWVNGVRVCR